ncbi:MAG: DUF416 family protein [Bacteroidetes bacterium]|nr:DUF416 family protein [Bacteroidota bacterium]
MINRNLDKIAVFGYLTAKRLFPNYAFFSNKYSFGDAKILENVLRQIKAKMDDESYQIDFNLLKRKLDEVTPAPENYDTVLASSALDACGAIYELASYLEDKDLEHISSIGTFATDSVDMYIQELLDLDMNDPTSEEKIAFHILMLREKKIQEDIWKYLNKMDAIDDGDIQTLEKLQDNAGMGNLDLK